MSSDSVRKKIEALGTQLSLPTVRKALGALEGEHASGRRGGSGDAMDVHAYEPGDESRLIDWKTSARQGRPMVVERERLSTSRVWLLMDVGLEMTGVCPSGERAWQVAANALRMFAALSLRRSDDISLVFGDESSITRVPFNGGFAQFERTLDKALDRDWDHHRNIDALLEYARRIKDREALIVLATDEHAMEERHITTIRRITRHPSDGADRCGDDESVQGRLIPPRSHRRLECTACAGIPAQRQGSGRGRYSSRVYGRGFGTGAHPCRFPYHSIRIQRIHVRSFRRPGVPGIGPHHTQ